MGEFLEKGFPFISLGNDLHHILTQTGAYVKDVEAISKEKGAHWTPPAVGVDLGRYITFGLSAAGSTWSNVRID